MRAENCNKKNAISCRIKEAFTLLEMMVSIFIFSMILLSIYEIWTLILMGKQASTYAAAEVQRTRVGMRALSESLMAARIFQANTNYYSFEVDNEGDFTALSFVSYLPPGFIGSGLYDGLPLRRITYIVEGNDAGGNSLILYQQPLLVDEEYIDVIPPIELTSDITLFQVEFWDTNELDCILDCESTHVLPQLTCVSVGYGHGDRGYPSQLDSRIIAMGGGEIPVDIQGTVNQNMTEVNQRGGGVPGQGGNRPGGNRGGGSPPVPPMP